MIDIAATLVIAGCAASPPPIDPSGSWVLEAGIVDGQIIPIGPGREVTLVIDGRQIGGKSPCNGYSATLDDVDGLVRVSELGGTLMLCDDARIRSCREQASCC